MVKINTIKLIEGYGLIDLEPNEDHYELINLPKHIQIKIHQSNLENLQIRWEMENLKQWSDVVEKIHIGDQ